eukprot:CAMPEP_0168466066 /NCGR_PEP_ID=MMETSP0228-20121227/56456_1 /TAXON_ID=133427 /ORGANISM="Protoceratium reticulatum, Strain CCCM 535 (=CCMP 1889)" /LENGTH=47 /DNA_ID= /DNA_START= /DNA_END= /DNA_ORIENTATION=
MQPPSMLTMTSAQATRSPSTARAREVSYVPVAPLRGHHSLGTVVKAS